MKTRSCTSPKAKPQVGGIEKWRSRKARRALP